MKCHFVLKEKDRPLRDIGPRKTLGGVPARGDTVSFQADDLGDRIVTHVDRLVGDWNGEKEDVAANVWVR